MRRGDNATHDRLTDQSVALIVKRRAQAAGLPPALLSGHSPRAGYATAAARAGVEERKIANVTRHKNLPVLRGYIPRRPRSTTSAKRCKPEGAFRRSSVAGTSLSRYLFRDQQKASSCRLPQARARGRRRPPSRREADRITARQQSVETQIGEPRLRAGCSGARAWSWPAPSTAQRGGASAHCRAVGVDLLVATKKPSPASMFGF
jgi:hypothetical protein